MTTATAKCGETISLSKPGEPNRTIRCFSPAMHETPCEGQALLNTFEGQVVATVSWTPIHKSSESGKGAK